MVEGECVKVCVCQQECAAACLLALLACAAHLIPYTRGRIAREVTYPVAKAQLVATLRARPRGGGGAAVLVE